MQAALNISLGDHRRKVLLINQDEIFFTNLKIVLGKLGVEVYHVANLDQVPCHLVENAPPDALLIDASPEPQLALEFVRKQASISPTLEIVILVNDQLQVQKEAFLELGVSAVFPLGLGFPAIAAMIKEKLADSLSGALASNLARDYPDFIGSSQRHFALLEQISRMKDASASVLIAGESGTGKELVARALHHASANRSQGNFEAINCGAIPEALLESELFGHKRGAFTDANSDKKGLFEVCSGGVLFLDEIGEMPLQLQVKLLRALQEKEIRPLGSTKTIAVDTRVIAATNRDLMAEVDQGSFRKDLYYRLAVLKIQTPALRERREDIPHLANHFLSRFAKENSKDIRPLSSSQVARLKLASWPGNIRELQNAIERAVILASGRELNLDDVFDDGTGIGENTQMGTGMEPVSLPLQHAQAKKMFEVLYLKNLLQHSRGNVSQAAMLADKTRVEIYRYLSRNHIEPSQFRLSRDGQKRKDC